MLIGVKDGDMKEKFAEERSIENMLRFVTKHMDHKTGNLTYNYKLNKHKNLNISVAFIYFSDPQKVWNAKI